MLRPASAIALLCLFGCTDKVKDVLPKVQPGFDKIRQQMEAFYDPPSGPEELAAPLSPKAVAALRGGNTQVLPHSRESELDPKLLIPSPLWTWLERTRKGAYLTSINDLTVTDDERAEIDGALATRYVVTYAVDHWAPPSPLVAGEATIVVRVYDLLAGKELQRIDLVSHVALGPDANEGSLMNRAHDDVLGALVSFTGVDVKLEPRMAATLEPLKARGTKLSEADKPKCTVEMPGQEAEQVRGLTCEAAESLAAQMRAKGFEAKVVPVKE